MDHCSSSTVHMDDLKSSNYFYKGVYKNIVFGAVDRTYESGNTV